MNETGGVSHDSAQDIIEILKGIDPQMTTGLHQGEDRRRRHAAVFATDEQPVLAANGQRMQAALGHIVVEAGVGVGQVVLKIGYQALVVRESLGKRGLGQDPPARIRSVTIAASSARSGRSSSWRMRSRSSRVRAQATRSSRNR